MENFNVRRTNGYTVMSKKHLRDNNLSYAAKGMLSFMLSLPPNWDYSFAGLVAISKEGKSAIRSIINELKEAGYVQITQRRNEKGYFQYNYEVLEEPSNIPLKNKYYPTPDFRTTDNRTSDNQLQMNTNKEIDKIDKTNCEEIHNLLTKELIKLNYISEDDISSFYFDNLFEEYLNKGYSYKQLMTCIHYIVPRVIERNYMDEEGSEIINKYGYFKNALESNFIKFENAKKLNDNALEFWSDGLFDKEGR